MRPLRLARDGPVGRPYDAPEKGESKMAPLPVLDLGDDPFERGLVHGRALAPAIADNLKTYLARFAAGGLDADAARREGEAWAGVIAGQNAEYGEEMSGIEIGRANV